MTPTADGDVTVNIAANVANDAGSNGNIAATPLTLTSDTHPADRDGQLRPRSDPTSTNPIPSR